MAKGQPVMAKTEKDWEVDAAVDALIRANEILNDKALMPKIRIRFQEKMKALQETALELKVSQKQQDIRKKK